jgi:hypothetical protein
MRTKEETVTSVAAIWAIPLREWEYEQALEADPTTARPYRYEIRTTNPWEDGCVKLHEGEVSMTLPGNIDVLRAAIGTLLEAKAAERLRFEERMEQLDNQIRKLALLEYNPIDDEVDSYGPSAI